MCRHHVRPGKSGALVGGPCGRDAGLSREGACGEVRGPRWAQAAPVLTIDPAPFLRPPPGSPLQFYVDAINSRHVSAYGPGLSHGMVNKPATFTIVTKDAGEGEGSRVGAASAGVRAEPLISALPPPTGGLSLAVEGPSKAEITCKDNKDGTCTVSYLPTAPGDYSIIVRFDDKHIPGSPFTAKITGGWTCGHTACRTHPSTQRMCKPSMFK